MDGFGTGNVATQARGAWLFDRIVTTGSVVLRTVGGDHAGTTAAHRYLSSPESGVACIVGALSARTVAACAGRRVVAVQDTSAIVCPGAAAGRHGLGPGAEGSRAGFFVHPVVAVDAGDEAVLGLVDAQVWTRAPERVAARHTRSTADKESQRWLVGTQAACTRLVGAAEVISVADREGDLYAHFAHHARHGGPRSALLVRARHDRALAEGGLMEAASDAWPVCDEATVTVPAGPGRRAREARVALRTGRVTVTGRAEAGPPGQLELGLVRVDEIDPPDGVAPLCWRLLTTLATETAADAREVVRLYRLRWRIEEVFRVLKGEGLALEASQVRVPEKLFRLAVLALGAAVRILQLVDARDGSPRPMQDVLDAAAHPVAAVLGRAREGATARQRNPHPPASLAWLAWIVARYGGWNCYGRPPGPKTMAQGWQRFSAALAGAIHLREATKPV